MELATAVRYNLPIIFIACDNQSYVSLPQSTKMKEISDLPEIDWMGFAKSFGMKASFSNDREEFKSQLTEAQNSKGPSLLWVTVPGLLDDEFKQTKTLEYKNWLTELKDKL
jgi:thiamine pyrophosphate-dependent acetolactate synthase large subunit-like protein